MFLCNSVMAHVHEMIDVTARLRSGSRYESERQLNNFFGCSKCSPLHRNDSADDATLGLLPVETLCAARAELAAEDQENRADVQRRDNKRKSVCASLSLFFFWSCVLPRV